MRHKQLHPITWVTHPISMPLSRTGKCRMTLTYFTIGQGELRVFDLIQTFWIKLQKIGTSSEISWGFPMQKLWEVGKTSFESFRKTNKNKMKCCLSYTKQNGYFYSLLNNTIFDRRKFGLWLSKFFEDCWRSFKWKAFFVVFIL